MLDQNKVDYVGIVRRLVTIQSDVLEYCDEINTLATTLGVMTSALLEKVRCSSLSQSLDMFEVKEKLMDMEKRQGL